MVFKPGCSSRIRLLTFYPSRIQGVKMAPDPGSATLTENPPPWSPELLLTWRRLDVVAGKDAVADPDSDFLPIPDPGSRGQKGTPDPGSGSATLIWKPPRRDPELVLTWRRLDVVAGKDTVADPYPDFLPILDPGVPDPDTQHWWKTPRRDPELLLTWSRLDVVAGKDTVADPYPDFLPIPDPDPQHWWKWKPPRDPELLLTWRRLDVVAGEDAGATVPDPDPQHWPKPPLPRRDPELRYRTHMEPARRSCWERHRCGSGS